MSICKIPCFICATEFENLNALSNQPLDGIEFTTYGHYGTTLFDPIDATELAINICDPCLIKGIENQRVLHMRAGAYADQVTIYKIPRVFETKEN